MRVSLGWLAEWIDLPGSEEELCERLTLAGLEIESVEHTGPDLSGLVVGEVLECAPHPNADRLSLCRVEAGDGEPVDVVCGAPNVAAGQRIAWARPGTVLPDGSKIKKSKIRGIASYGMICSERELGLGGEAGGILVLDPATSPGIPLAEVVGAGQTVLDLEITPNRGDWASMLGIAREVRAHFGGTLRLPEHEPPEGSRPAAQDIRIDIEASEDCYLYVGRVVRGIRVGPSPAWLCERLEAAGMRPVNVVVDVSNLVLLEFGQPLHAFDLDTLRGGRVCVRRARGGEKLRTLDDQTRELLADDLVIADAERAIAVAGVMGGAETEVREGTTNVLIESAHFHPARVRRTARRLGLRSEASYRFERGVDREGVRRAADRAARLLAELASGTVSMGAIEVRGEAFPAVREVTLDPASINRLLGTSLQTEEVVAILGRLDIRASLDGQSRLRCGIPSYRNDLAIAEDIVEEVARIYGYDRIPTTLPECELREVHRPRSYRLADRARDSLCVSGLLEMRSFPGISAADLDALRLSADDARRSSVRLLNPITESDAELRTTLVPSLLRAARQNQARQVDRIRLFEVAHVFIAGREGELPAEPTQAAGVLLPGERGGLWDAKEPPPVFFEARGVAEQALSDLGVEAEFRPGSEQPYLHPGASGEFFAAGRSLAWVGELHPEVATRYGITGPCALFEIDLAVAEALPERVPRYREVSRHPAVRRDLAVLLDQSCPVGDVLAAVRKTGGSSLVAVDVFDRYEGRGVPDGKLSVAMRLIFQRSDRTLTDAETKRTMDRVVKMLADRFGGLLR